MCPLRLILIFLSASLAGFFVIRNLKSQIKTIREEENDDEDDPYTNLKHTNNSLSVFSKVRTVVESLFWVFVDMASGRYLWRHLVSSNSNPSS